MFCSKCGKENPDNAVFCESCGNRLEDGANKTVVPQYVKDYAKDVFIEPDEELLGSLGDGWLVNLMFGRLKKCNALLTNKRLYLQGQIFMGDGSLKGVTKGNIEQVLDVRYITGTYFEYTKKVGMLIWAIISIPLIIPSIILFIGYFKSRKCYFRIDFGYGFTKAIRIDASVLGIAHVKDFERQVIRAKDAARADIERRFEKRG